MNDFCTRLILIAATFVFAIGLAPHSKKSLIADEINSDDLKFFEEKIRPVLVQHCYECHAGDSKIVRGGLLVDHRDALLAGGDSGPAVVPGDLDESLIIGALKHETFEMPPRVKLPDSVIADFEAWIKRGAPDPRDQGQGDDSKQRNLDEERQHWAFQPLTSPEPPAVQNEDWVRSPIDRFILHELEKQNMKPAPQAEKEVLLRRVTFDLIGLPPTPEDIEAFLNDDRPEAYSLVVDRLLESPRYGERWARHWLDLVRYADSNGADENINMPEAWRYRDWVIEQFNNDLPFDQFVIQQLAGDLLPVPNNEKAAADLLTATGMLVLGPKMLAEQDKEKMLIDIVDEQIDTVSRTFLGLTIACARCHDHKFDPVSAEDYYALAGIFASTRTMENTAFVSEWLERVLAFEEIDRQRAEYQPKIDEAKAELERRHQALTEASADEKGTLQKAVDEQKAELEKVEKGMPKLAMAMAVEEGKPHDLPVHIRGNHLAVSKELSPRGVPDVLTETAPFSGIANDRSGRLELAEWLVSSENPLTHRVMVNRIWQWFFGEGIVRTPSNFGLMGQKPTHPELLDWLAREFESGGGSFKEFHKTVLLSATYQMSSQTSPEYALSDPENRYWSHQNKRRLDAEQIRDALLAIPNDLDLTLGGQSASVNSKRRAVYLRVDRSNLYELFAIFDLVETANHIEQRPTTIVPHQALFLMNNQLVHEEAKKLVVNILQKERSSHERIQDIYLRLFGRSPSPDEIEMTEAFLVKANILQGNTDQSDVAWETLARAMIASNEFIFLD